MYINLPSKNHYRRPASYTSKGYHTRRMAVDFAIPLITNVKNAKMLAEALVRKLPLDVSSVDSKSSHRTHTFPGLVNVAAFVPGLAVPNSQDFIDATRASISAGFTTSIIIPQAQDNGIVDRATLEVAKANVLGSAYCNFALCLSASADNVHVFDEELKADAKALFIPFRIANKPIPLSAVAAHFSSWPTEKPIITDAKGSDLASLLLLASLHSRSIHVTDVQTIDDVLLISLSKAKNLKVTCDVSVYSLFFTREQFPLAPFLSSLEDQKALWKKLDLIDAFSIGSSPYKLALEINELGSAASGMEEALPLLLTAVTEGRLSLQDITTRLHDNPVQIFGLPEQAQTHVEVVLGRQAPFVTRPSCWSPLGQTLVSGAIHRVIVHGQTSFLDGSLSQTPLGKDISSATISHGLSAVVPPSPALKPSDHLVSTTSVTQSQAGGSLMYGPLTHSQKHFTSIQPHPAFYRRHILSVKQFTHRDMYDLFSLAHEMRLQVERNGTLDILKGKVLCTAFYEPSTRTSSSFDAAMKRCGGQVVQITADSSSVAKGESLPDTIRTLGCYGDAIVIRHPDVGSAQTAAKFSPVPIINAGDGIGEHPTQVSSIYSNRYREVSWSFVRLYLMFTQSVRNLVP